MKALTRAICTTYSEHYKAHTEKTFDFIRPRNKYLTERGIQRKVGKHYTVIRVERLQLGN